MLRGPFHLLRRGATVPSPDRSFLLDLDAPLGAELQRVLVGQADRALIPLEVAGPAEPVVHEARKASKRGRAIGHLVRGVAGKAAWRAVDAAFRDAARLLGPLRDADVARKNLGEAAPPRPDDPRIGRAAVDAYRLARTRVEALDLSAATRDDLLRGLADSWRTARRVGRHVQPGEPETFHAWRKAVKRLYHQVQLIGAVQPEVVGGFADQLDFLQEALGDHHDTVVAAELGGAPPDRLAELEARRRALEQRTIPLGSWLFDAPSKRFVGWVAAALDALTS